MTRLYDLGGSLLSAVALALLAAPGAAQPVMLMPTCLGGHVTIPIAPGPPPRREDGACHVMCLHRRLVGTETEDEI